jgi:hypothetical protein
VIDWEQPMKAITELKPCTAASRGMIKQRLVVDNTLEVRHAALRNSATVLIVPPHDR